MSHVFVRECSLAHALAGALRDESEHLARHWLNRIARRVDAESLANVDATILVRGVADYLETPVNEIGADSAAIAQAMALGESRYANGFDVYEILKEYELLGCVLFSFVAGAAGALGDECEQGRGSVLSCGQRLYRALALIERASLVQFMRLADQRRRAREEQLRTFNRGVSHEIKNRIGTLLAASEALLMLPEADDAQRTQFMEMIVRNTRLLRHTVDNLVALSRTENDARHNYQLRLAVAAREAARQLRENSRVAQVEIRLEQLPDVEVNAAAVELCVTNYLSNAIKYADPKQPHRYAAISGTVETTPDGRREVVVRVRDNGVGVPLEKRRRLFQRFYRAHDGSTVHADGTGLGLSIVSETVASLGGRAWAEFPPNGSVFAFSLPYRRERTGDAA